MATNKLVVPNIDASDLVNYPNGRVKDNTGVGDGTPVNRLLYSDLHEFFAKVMRLAAIPYSGLPDSEGNGYQLVQAVQALAGKNDMLYTLNSDGTTVAIAVQLAILLNGETLFCKAAFNYAAEANIIGNDTPGVVTKALAVSSSFKTGDILLLQVTGGGITLIRVATADNLDVLVTALNYLKATSNATEFTGTATNVATTPSSNKAAFARRVNGADSSTYLVTESVNGLMSAADKVILDGLNNPVKNRGWVSGIDVANNTVGSHLAVGGDISDAIALGQDLATPKAQEYQVNFAHAMANTNYMVQLFIESQTPTANSDASVFTPVFRNKLVGSCTFILREGINVTQSLKVHVKVEQLV